VNYKKQTVASTLLCSMKTMTEDRHCD